MTKPPLRKVIRKSERYQTIRVRYTLECGHGRSKTYNILNGEKHIHPTRMRCIHCEEVPA